MCAHVQQIMSHSWLHTCKLGPLNYHLTHDNTKVSHPPTPKPNKPPPRLVTRQYAPPLPPTSPPRSHRRRPHDRPPPLPESPRPSPAPFWLLSAARTLAAGAGKIFNVFCSDDSSDYSDSVLSTPNASLCCNFLTNLSVKFCF